MQIIVVDPRLSRARTITVDKPMLLIAAAGLLSAVLLAVIGLYAVTFRVAAEVRIPLVHEIVTFIMRDEVARNEQFVRDNVTAMARKLGEMQAQLMRLDALGERVSKMSGIRPEEFSFREPPGRGGAEPTAGARAMTLAELQNELQRIARGVEDRADYMDVIESELVSAQVRRALLPQNTPVSEGFVGSGFGMRTDPFTGQLAMHAGVDFAAPTGTPIFAAAGGVVATAEANPVYGNSVLIDHGNGLSTLYAHASKLVVKTGDIVKRGQKIAEVGSTGRSTGPHLHFEVHVNGVPQNPSKFLLAQKAGSPFAALAAADSRGRPVDVKGLAAAARAGR
ncbi:MAG: M23 family metallopeptidase [Pseudomonadota bacterium]